MPNFPFWPPRNPFPSSQRDTVGDGSSDFPGSAGSREQGKFRPSSEPKLTAVAVVSDEGTPLVKTTDALLAELILEVRLLRHSQILTGVAADIDMPIK